MCMLMVVAFMPTMAFADSNPAKIEVSVTSGGNALKAEVYKDYSATVILPASNTKINFASATVSATVTGLQKLGMGATESRHESKTIKTKSNATATVAQYFGKAYNFDTRTVMIDVNKKRVNYTVISSGTDTIEAKPSNTDLAAAVWAEFASYTNLSTETSVKNDATTPTISVDNNGKITAEFAKGSYVQVGTSKLALKDGYKATVEVKGVSGINSDDRTRLNSLYNKVLKGTNIEESDAVAVKNILNKVKVVKEITVTVTFEEVKNEPKPIYPWGGGTIITPVKPAEEEPPVEEEKTIQEKLVEAKSELNSAIAENEFKAKSAKQTELHGKKAVKVSWNKVEGADGYEVFRSTKKNSGYGTKPYFTTKKTTYTNNKELKKGKTYYYKVRAYKLVDGKKAYSDWSLKAWRTIK